MTYPSPIEWSTIEDALVAWVVRATGLTTVWANQNAPQPTRSFVSLDWTTGAVRVGMDGTTDSTDLTSVLDIKITPTAANATTYTATLEGVAYPYTSSGAATVSEVTAGLASAISAVLYTVTDNGTDLDVTSVDGEVFTCVLTDDGSGSLMSFANNDTGHEVTVNIGGVRNATLSVNVYCSADTATAGARRFMSALEGSFQLPTEIEARTAASYGWLGNSPPQDLNELAGPKFISRQQMDVFLNLPANLSQDRGYIDTIKITSTDLGWTDQEFGDV